MERWERYKARGAMWEPNIHRTQLGPLTVLLELRKLSDLPLPVVSGPDYPGTRLKTFNVKLNFLYTQETPGSESYSASDYSKWSLEISTKSLNFHLTLNSYCTNAIGDVQKLEPFSLNSHSRNVSYYLHDPWHLT